MNDVPVLPAVMQCERSEMDRRIFGLIREIRAACQYLQQLIDDLVPVVSALPVGERCTHTRSVLSHALLTRVGGKVDEALLGIRHIFARSSTEFEWCGDEYTTIDLDWSEIKEAVRATAAAQTYDEAALKRLSKDLDLVIFRCVSLTLSPRVNDILGNLRIGQRLDIEFEFGDEFPKGRELRTRLLQELEQQSAVIACGVVDADAGVIYKAERSRQRQLLSAWRLFGWMLLGALVPILLAEAGNQKLANWPFHMSDLRWLLQDYVLIFIGCGAHFAIETLKAAKAAKRRTFQPVTDWVLWVHIREAQIMKGILYIIFGYILLVFGLNKGGNKLDWTSAFFAGYSIDSVTELFLDRFTTIVSARTKELTKLIPA